MKCSLKLWSFLGFLFLSQMAFAQAVITLTSNPYVTVKNFFDSLIPRNYQSMTLVGQLDDAQNSKCTVVVQKGKTGGLDEYLVYFNGRLIVFSHDSLKSMIRERYSDIELRSNSAENAQALQIRTVWENGEIVPFSQEIFNLELVGAVNSPKHFKVTFTEINQTTGTHAQTCAGSMTLYQ